MNKKNSPIYAYNAQTKEEYVFYSSAEATEFLGVKKQSRSAFYPCFDAKDLRHKYYRGYYWSKTRISKEELSSIPSRTTEVKNVRSLDFINENYPLYVYLKATGMKVASVRSPEEFKKMFGKNTPSALIIAKQSEAVGKEFARSYRGYVFSRTLYTSPSHVLSIVNRRVKESAALRWKSRREREEKHGTL